MDAVWSRLHSESSLELRLIFCSCYQSAITEALLINILNGSSMCDGCVLHKLIALLALYKFHETGTELSSHVYVYSIHMCMQWKSWTMLIQPTHSQLSTRAYSCLIVLYRTCLHLLVQQNHNKLHLSHHVSTPLLYNAHCNMCCCGESQPKCYRPNNVSDLPP